MRRARIQMKPNLAKSARFQPVKKENAEEVPVLPVLPVETAEAHGNNEAVPEAELIVAEAQPDREYTELKSVFVVPSLPNEVENVKQQRSGAEETQKNHHVHFEDGVNMREGQNQMREGLELASTSNVLRSSNDQLSPNVQSPITHHYIQQKPVPRSRNVSLCEDDARTHSKNHKERRRFTGKEEIDTKTWKMADLALYNPKHEKAIYKRERKTSGSSVVTKSECTESTVSSSPVVNAPQVKIGADGKLVIDETSLVAQSALVNHESVWENVEEGRMGSKITSMSFRNKIFRKSTTWSDRETDLFYEVLRCTGSDFGLMHYYLPQRTRFELKAKYNREEKTNWSRVNSTLSQPAALDEKLQERITSLSNDIDTEVREKKERIEYMKSEERRVRQEIRDQKQIEKEELNNRRNEVRQMLLIAREKSKEAKEMGRIEREQERQAKNLAKEKARMMNEQARRMAVEAKMLIVEARRQEKESQAKMKKLKKEESEEQDSLEREAERIIRSLISAEKKEKYRALMQKRKNGLKAEPPKDEKAAPVVVAPASEAPVVVAPIDGTPVDVPSVVAPPVVAEPDEPSSSSAPQPSADAPADSVKDMQVEDTVAPDEENEDGIPSESSSSSDSDEEALREHEIERETARMNAERRNLEPRKTKIINKPIYVPHDNVKYALQPVEKTIEMAKNSGTMFDSADEDDDIFVGDSSPPEQKIPAVPESVAPVEPVEPVKPVEPVAPVEPAEPAEPIPKAVEDVVMAIGRERSATPPVNSEKRKSAEVEKESEVSAKKARSEGAVDAVEKVGEPVLEGNPEIAVDKDMPSTSAAPSTSSNSDIAPVAVTAPALPRPPMKRRMVPRLTLAKKPAGLSSKPKTN